MDTAEYDEVQAQKGSVDFAGGFFLVLIALAILGSIAYLAYPVK
jgi:hypothetical protein